MRKVLPALLLVATVACGKAPSMDDAVLDGAAAIQPVPTPDLSAAAEGAREQIDELDAALHAALDDSDATDEARAEAFGALGSVYLIYDFLDAATVSFANARALEPDDHRWPYLLGYVHQLRGDLPAAVERFEETLERAPGFQPATLRLGRAKLDLGELDAAEALFRGVLEKGSENAPGAAAAFEGLGKIAVARGEDSLAVEQLEKALARAPEANGLYYSLAQAYRRLGDVARAEANLEKRGDVAVRIPDPVISALGTLGKSVQLYLVQGAEAMEDGDYQKAAGAYQQALEVDDANLTAYRGLSFAVERLGDREAAIGHLETALEKANATPDTDTAARAEILRTLGGLLVQAGRDGAAIARLEASLALEPEAAGARLALANALARQGRFDAALPHYDRLLAARPELAADLLEKRAVALINLGRGDDALADLRKAVDASPEDAGLRRRYADALAFLGRDDAAAAQRAEAVRLGSADTPEARARLLVDTARSLLAGGDYEKAIEHFDEALRLDPEQPEVRFQLAGVLGHVGYFDDALREFRAVVEKVPRHAGARRGEIAVLLLTGRFGEARVRLNDAVRTFPLDAGLALIQARLLATCPDERVRDGALALEIAGRLDRVRQDRPAREVMALALAAAGRFDEAIALQRDLLAQAEQAGDPSLVADQRAKLERFESRRPWSASSGEEILAGAAG